MAENAYLISYDKTEGVKFPSRKGMQAYLEEEAQLWMPFLDNMSDNLDPEIQFGFNRYLVSPPQLAQAFDNIKKRLDDQNQFNQASKRSGGQVIVLPPPTSSLTGELILGLFEVELK